MYFHLPIWETRLRSDSSFESIESKVADSEAATPGSDRVPALVALSEKTKADGAFSRQLRRKFV